MNVERYISSEQQTWDEFVLQTSVNGNFLQTRQFLNYHQSDRFEDCSIIIKVKGKIIAVCPANKKIVQNEVCFVSHQGSTYGGLIIHPKYHSAKKLMELVRGVEDYLRDEGFNRIIYKNVIGILSEKHSELLEFLYLHEGYTETVELNHYIDMMNYNDNVLSNLRRDKRYNVQKCINAGFRCERLTDSEQLRVIYDLIVETLKKYNVNPVHTYEELSELVFERCSEYVVPYAVFAGEEMVAGSIVFLFPKYKCLHTQYLAARKEYEKLSPMSFVYYSMIEETKKMGYRYITFGISTEHGGREINEGLTDNKEAFGGSHLLNRIFEKKI